MLFKCNLRHDRTAAKVNELKEKVSRLRLLGSELELVCRDEKKKQLEECRPFFRKEREYTRLLQMRNMQLLKERGEWTVGEYK